MVIAAYTMAYERQFTADFTHSPFFIDDSVFVYKKPDPTAEVMTLFVRVSDCKG